MALVGLSFLLPYISTEEIFINDRIIFPFKFYLICLAVAFVFNDYNLPCHPILPESGCNHLIYTNKSNTCFRLLVDCRIESNCPGTGTIGGMPSVGVFLKDPSPYLRKFRRKPWKIPNG